MTPSAPVQFEELLEIGANSHGWTFAVGLVSGRWWCLALGYLGNGGNRFIHVMPAGSEGYQMGLTDKAKAIRLVSVIAKDPEQSFGGVDVWQIPESERGTADEFRCENCGRIGCQDDCAADYGPEFEGP